MLKLPPGYAALPSEARAATDLVLDLLTTIEKVECILWGGSSVSAGLKTDGSDIDLWVIVSDPTAAFQQFLEAIRKQDSITHIHQAGHLPWFGLLVSLFYRPDCSFSIDVGFANPSELERLNVGPGYWILDCTPATRAQIREHVQPRDYAHSIEQYASDLLVNIAKIRKSLQHTDIWNALEYLARGRRALMWVLRRKKEGAVGYYSRPERDFDRYLTLRERRALEATASGPNRTEIERATGNLVRHFLAETEEMIPAGSSQALVAIARALLSEPKPHQDIGIIGVGRIGSRLIRHLITHGHVVWANDLDAENSARAQRAGAKVASFNEIAEQCTTVILCLPNSDVGEEIVAKLLQFATPSRLLIDLGTNPPDRAVHLSNLARESGHAFVDAPLSGGVWGADRGDVLVMAGGTREDVTRASSILRCFAREVVHVGPSGHGCIAKLLHNLVGETEVHAFAEAFSVGARLGIDQNALFRCLAGGMASSRVLTDLYASAGLRRNWQPNVTLATATKDQQLLLDLALRTGIELTFTPEILARQRELLGQGFGDADVTATVKWFEARHKAHVRVESPPLPAGDGE